MPKITGKYETIFIVNATLTEEAINAVVEKFTNLIAANGEITKIETDTPMPPASTTAWTRIPTASPL